jgi:hypothetical protein
MKHPIYRWPPEELVPFKNALAEALLRLEELRRLPVFPY